MLISRLVTFGREKATELKCKNIDYSHLTSIIDGRTKKADEKKKSKEDDQTLTEFNSAHRRS